MTIPDVQPIPCSYVNSFSNNSIEQCKFVLDNDCLEDDSLIDYVYLVYCDFGLELRYASILLVIFLVILLFLALSAVADEFLCTSLLTVSRNLRMSDSVAGVTLLAFGNGCPDIFSSLAAANDERSELIIGELLGAGIFCTSIVSGLIFVHSDFKLASRPILRDTTFYLIAVYLIWSYCWCREITFYGSLAFIIIYVIYLSVALGGQAVYSRLQGNYAIAEVYSGYMTGKGEAEKEGIWFGNKDGEIGSKINTKDVTSDDCLGKETDLRPRHKDAVNEVHLGLSHLDPFNSFPLEMQLHSAISKAPDVKEYHRSKATIDMEDVKFNPNSNSTGLQQHTLNLQHHLNMNIADFNISEWEQFLDCINPLDVSKWYTMNGVTKAVAILKAPIQFLALLTIPVVDFNQRNSGWCRPLNSLHCISVPLFIVLITNIWNSENFGISGFHFVAIILMIAIIVAIAVFKVTCANKAPRFHLIYAYIGFLMSILWIYKLATEMISLLKTVGVMFSMSDTAIGLGILAWGNSLGDIVANISLAEAGYPRMAIGACIGAPLLNLLLGFGLSFTISLKPGQFSQVEYSPTITLLCSTLTIILLSLMISTLIPQHRSKKPFGYMLIAGYGIYFALAVCLEYGLIKFS